jgi:glycosyltransferase involved in cell wall biosynthesis
MLTININGRFRGAVLTGVQRAASCSISALKNLDNSINVREIDCHYLGIKGHLWEQSILSTYKSDEILWSPANTGPVLRNNHVVSIYDVSPLEHPEWFSPAYAKWYSFMWRSMAKRVRGIITDSQDAKSRIIRLLNIEPFKVECVYLGVDFDKWRNAPAVVLERLPKRYLLALGSLEPRKNISRLIQAWSSLSTDDKCGHSLVLAGGLGDKRIFSQQSQIYIPDDVVLLGRVDEKFLPSLYTGATAFIYPSLYEGFGLPPLEAMAMGTPVITGNLTSLPEIIGTCGILIDPYSTDEIRSSIRKIINNAGLRELLSESGVKRAQEYTWLKTAHGLSNFFRYLN